MNTKGRVKDLIKEQVDSGNNIDWLILSRFDFVTLVFELYGHILLDEIRIVSKDSIQEGKAQIVNAKGIKDVQL